MPDSSRWSTSYSGQKSFFINNSVIVYLCGSTIKFLNADTNETQTFVPPHVSSVEALANCNNGVCLLTANACSNKFAYSDTQLSPKVYVYDFDPGFREISQLLGLYY